MGCRIDQCAAGVRQTTLTDCGCGWAWSICGRSRVDGGPVQFSRFFGRWCICSGEVVWGLPVLGTAAAFQNYVNQATHAIVAIGNNVLRQKLFAQLQAAGFELANVIHPKAMVSSCAQLGAGVAVMAGAIVGTEATLGQGAIVNCGAVVDYHAQVHEFGHLGVNACMAGGSVLGRLAWMQAGSAIGYCVQIAAGTLLNPGAAL